ncbi:spoIIIJ-associated protein [Peptoniphilus olsenii]|uniref:RNA-binding protein KhpB n=1 Tax=Peptoniphilus olsenii TaxID=411570 RepID=A0ABV2JAC3_9FIRM
MNYVIKTGKTVDEAVREALIELNITEDDAIIEVLEEAQKGFLGIIGSKDATVKVSRKIDDTKSILNEIFNEDIEPEKSQEKVQEIEPEIENNVFHEESEDLKEINDDISEDQVIIETATEFMKKILDTFELNNEIDASLEGNTLSVNVLGDENKLGILIGKRGVTLDSIQYILNLIVNKKSSRYIRVTLDTSGYRQKRKKTLQELAQKLANKVIKTGRAVRLEPMNAYERKIIHTSLQDFEGVITHSEGKDPFRKVVIQKERKY